MRTPIVLGRYILRANLRLILSVLSLILRKRLVVEASFFFFSWTFLSIFYRERLILNLRIQYIVSINIESPQNLIQPFLNFKQGLLIIGGKSHCNPHQILPTDNNGLQYLIFELLFMYFSLISPYIQSNQEIPKDNILVNVTQLSSINRKSILKYLVKNEKIGAEMEELNVITSNPRNFYLDTLLSKNYDIFYDQDQIKQEEAASIKRLFKLPLHFEIVKPDAEQIIDCQTELITVNHFNVLRKIGEGTFAEIFLVERRYDKQLLCMKRINKAECERKGNLTMIKNEYEILEYPSKYKVKLYYQFEDQRYVYFIEQFCVHGDLYSIIRLNKKADEGHRLSLTEKYIIWIQIAFGIVSLHQKGLIYRDLKPENILLNQNGQIKICDFGFTSRIDPNEKMKELCGSYEYLAPEIIKREGYNKSIDIYCLGLLFYQLLVGSNPFEGVTPDNISEMKSKSINYDKKSLSTTVKDLLKKMLKEKQEERIGYESSLELFRHDFFKENQDLVMKIIENKVLIKNLVYAQPLRLQEREEINQKMGYVFPDQSFNYIRPFFDVTENVGPKLNFTK